MMNNYMTVILRWMESYHGFICREQGSLQGSESLSRLVQSAFLCTERFKRSVSVLQPNDKEEGIWQFLKEPALLL